MVMAMSGCWLMKLIMSLWDSETRRVGAMAATVEDRAPRSNSESSPMISPGPRTAMRFSLPSSDEWLSLTFPSVTM